MQNFIMQTQKNNNTSVEAYLYSAGAQHGNLHQFSVKMSRVTYFILRAHTGFSISHSQHKKNSAEVFGRKKSRLMDWKGRN